MKGATPYTVKLTVRNANGEATKTKANCIIGYGAYLEGSVISPPDTTSDLAEAQYVEPNGNGMPVWELPGWYYCKTHSLAHIGITDYQYKYTLYYGNGTSSGNTAYLNGHCNRDFSDIRFTLGDGVVLPYYIKTLVTGVSAEVWVKFPSITTSTRVNLYYGNPSAPSLSNGNNVFLFFDDFEFLDALKWDTTYLGSGSVSIHNHALRIVKSTTNGNMPIILSKNKINPANSILEAEINLEALTEQSFGLNLRPSLTSDAYRLFFLASSDGTVNDTFGDFTGDGVYDTQANLVSSWDLGVDYVFRYVFAPESTTWARDGTKTMFSMPYTQPVNIMLGFWKPNYGWIASFTANIKTIYQRKYASAEPVASNWGSEIGCNGPPSADFSVSVAYGVYPLRVQFYDISAGYNITSWLWEFGDGQTSTLQNPVHTYSGDSSVYPWISINGRRSTADIAWQYDISFHGDDVPLAFRRLELSDSSSCRMLGEPVEQVIEKDYPATITNLTCYSYGYYLNNIPPYKLRQSFAGIDIPIWARLNFKGSTTDRAAEILDYENPTHYLKRLLWPLDANGNITIAGGYYNLYCGAMELVPNWGIGIGKPCKITAILNPTETKLFVEDLSLFPAPVAGSQVKVFSYTDDDGDGSYDDGETETDYEVCTYTGRYTAAGVAATSGAGYLTVVRGSPEKLWNPTNSMAVYLENTFNPKHQAVETKQFIFDGKPITDILSEMADHCGMAYTTRFKLVDGVWREHFYWVPKYRIAEGAFGLPAAVTITPDNPYLKGSPGPGATIGLDKSYNAVIVEACRIKDSAWFYGFACKPVVRKVFDTDGVTPIGFAPVNEIPRVLPFRTESLLPEPKAGTWNTTVDKNTNYGPGGVNYGTEAENQEAQRLVNLKATQVLQYANYQVPSYTASFIDQEFELYQSLYFKGFSGFPEDEMQITDISKTYTNAGDGGYSVDITCSKKEDLQASGKFQSIIDEIQANYEKLLNSSENTDSQKIGVVIGTDTAGTMASVQLRSTGNLIKTRSYGARTVS